MATDSVTQTSVSQLPGYMQPYQKEILERAKDLSGDTLAMPAYQVAGMSPGQQGAVDMAYGGLGVYQPYLDQGTSAIMGGLQTYGQGVGMTNTAANTIGGSMGGFSGQGYQDFMNPYMDSVVNQTMNDISRQGQQQQLQAAGNSIGAGAFGGSRQGVQQAEIGRNMLDTQARASGDLRSQGFTNAMNTAGTAFENQQTRIGQAGQAYGQLGQGLGSLAGGMTSAGTSMAGLGSSAQAMGQSDTDQLYQYGSYEQGQQQAEIDANRNTQTQNIMQPYQQLGFYSDIFNSMPTSQMSFMSQPAANPYSQAAGLGLGAYGMYNYNQAQQQP